MDALFTLSASCTSSTCCASIALFTLGTDYDTKVGDLTVCICNDKLTAGIDFGRRNTDTISTIHTDNLIQVDSLAIGESQNKLTFSIDIGSSNTDAFFTRSAILAVCTIFAIGTVLAISAVFAIQAIGNTKVQHSTIGKSNQQFIVFGESCSLDTYTVFTSSCLKGCCPFGFSTSIAILLGNLVCRFAIQTIQPFLNSSFVAILNCQLISGQSVFNGSGCRFYQFVDDKCSTSSKAYDQDYCNDDCNYLFSSCHRHFSFLQIKSAATEATAQKTQTPIVAKPIQYKGITAHQYRRICVFIKFTALAKGRNIPIEKHKNALLYIKLVWHYQFIILFY